MYLMLWKHFRHVMLTKTTREQRTCLKNLLQSFLRCIIPQQKLADNQLLRRREYWCDGAYRWYYWWAVGCERREVWVSWQLTRQWVYVLGLRRELRWGRWMKGFQMGFRKHYTKFSELWADESVAWAKQTSCLCCNLYLLCVHTLYFKLSDNEKKSKWMSNKLRALTTFVDRHHLNVLECFWHYVWLRCYVWEKVFTTCMSIYRLEAVMWTKTEWKWKDWLVQWFT